MKLKPIQQKKGNMVMGLVMIVSIAAFAIFLLITGYIGKTVATELQGKIGISESINKSLQTTITTSTVTVNSFWYIVFAGLLLGVFISAFFIPEYPAVTVPIFLIILVVTTIVAIAMSNAYEQLAAVTQLQDQATNIGSIGFIMGKLPYVAIIVGLIAIIIAFTRSSGGGGAGGAIVG